MDSKLRTVITSKILATLAICPLLAQVNVTTQHNDNRRTGQNTSETTLTSSNVNATDFGAIAKMAVDGQVYAQPLVLTNVQIGGGTNSAVYIATEHDSVYAFDATTGVQYWHTSFINPSKGITTVPLGGFCNDIDPNNTFKEFGITSTPVINPATNTLYVVANTYENGSYYYRLHALNALTGAEISGSPVVIQTPSGAPALNAQMENQRTALLLTNGHIIFGFSSHCDSSPWYGFVFSYNASTLARENEFTVVPSGEGGVWMGGDGVAADANGYIYFATGNGDFDGSSSWGDSILKLAPPPASWGSPVSFYTPGNQSYLAESSVDLDLAGGGVVLLPDLPTGTPHYQRLAQAGKQGIISIVDRNAMGGYCCVTSGSTPHDTNIVQEIEGQITHGIWGSPAYWNGYIYFGPNDDGVKAFSFNLSTGSVSTSPVAQSASGCGDGNNGPHFSCSISISSSGTSNGILWYLDSYTGFLYALNATTLTELYNSDQTQRDWLTPYQGVKFAAPTVANGKVYVGAAGVVGIFGENPPALYWQGSSGPVGCGNGTAIVSATQNGVDSMVWTFQSVNGPKLVYSISWSLSDSKGQFGSGTISSPNGAVQLKGTGNASRTPVGQVTVKGTTSFATNVGTCNAPYSILTSGVS